MPSRRYPEFEKITKDPLDLRDRMYEPSLTELPFQVDNRDDVPKVLDQGKEGACTGFALAAVVNFLIRNRSNSEGLCPNLVSAKMLYEMAKRYDEWNGENYEGSSIRGAMKGWNRHGVCDESLWPHSGTGGRLTSEVQIDALRRPLGAYYRVRHLHLNHMHAALNEAGILYASASVHEGWNQVDAKGKIPYRERKIGGHAFAVVGYDYHGFWIQNSWGKKWGADGFCHISYDDWLENGWDCWVARLGVPTSGWQATEKPTYARVTSLDYIPHESLVLADIQAHFVNLGNDGKLSGRGRYSTDIDDMKDIFRRSLPAITADWKRRRLLLYAHGGLNNEKASASRIASMKGILLKNEIYPVHFMWETGVFETVANIVEDAFRRKRFHGWSDTLKELFYDLLDEAIELAARPLGGPLWREMKENAKRASDRGGGAQLVAQEIRSCQAQGNPLEVHLVGHSAGSILLSHLVPALLNVGINVKTLTLFAPACTVDLFRAKILKYSKPAPGAGVGAITIFNLDDSTERNDSVGPIYCKSLLYLVSEAFERKKGTKLLGMDKFIERDQVIMTGLPNKKSSNHCTKIYSNNSTKVSLESASKTHGGFDDDEQTLNSMLRIIRGGNQLHHRFT